MRTNISSVPCKKNDICHVFNNSSKKVSVDAKKRLALVLKYYNKMAKKSISRTQYRDMENKFTPAIKTLSSHMHNTGKIPDSFLGYKVPAGKFKDGNGVEWQIQAWAVCSKKHQLKKNEVVPMVRKWAIGLKIRIFLKYLIDWSSK